MHGTNPLSDHRRLRSRAWEELTENGVSRSSGYGGPSAGKAESGRRRCGPDEAAGSEEGTGEHDNKMWSGEEAAGGMGDGE